MKINNFILLFFLCIQFCLTAQGNKNLRYVTDIDGLTIRDKPSLRGKKIDKANYLEQIIVKKILYRKKQRIRYKKKYYRGHWALIERNNKKAAYALTIFLKPKETVAKTIREKIDKNYLKINGVLPYKCNEKQFLKYLGKPDSIVINKVKNTNYTDNRKIELKKKFNDVYRYKVYENDENCNCSKFREDCSNVKTYYKSGIVYEEFNNQMYFIRVDFLKNKKIYIKYKKYIWNSKSTFDKVAKLFPLHKTYTTELINYYTFLEHPGFEKKSEWLMSFDKEKDNLIDFHLY